MQILSTRWVTKLFIFCLCTLLQLQFFLFFFALLMYVMGCIFMRVYWNYLFIETICLLKLSSTVVPIPSHSHMFLFHTDGIFQVKNFRTQATGGQLSDQARRDQAADMAMKLAMMMGMDDESDSGSDWISARCLILKIDGYMWWSFWVLNVYISKALRLWFVQCLECF